MTDICRQKLAEAGGKKFGENSVSSLDAEQSIVYHGIGDICLFLRNCLHNNTVERRQGRVRKTMIRLTDVVKEYPNGTHALNGLSMEIQDGEFVFMVGPSGSGKSTVIKLLIGEIEPSAGRVMVNGFSLQNIREWQIPHMRRTVGVIFQDFRLIDHKTVYDNMVFAMRAVGAGPREIKKRIPYCLNLVGLENKGRRLPTELSGGEQQRVAIARALAKNPKLLLCDEPTGALDYNTGKAVLKLLQSTCRDMGKTVVVITHNQALTAMADRIITVRNGTVADMVRNENPVDVDTLEW